MLQYTVVVSSSTSKQLTGHTASIKEACCKYTLRALLFHGQQQWPSRCRYPLDVQIERFNLCHMEYICLALHFGWAATLDFRYVRSPVVTLSLYYLTALDVFGSVCWPKNSSRSYSVKRFMLAWPVTYLTDAVSFRVSSTAIRATSARSTSIDHR